MDFFISYNKADRDWAEWIAWQLDEANYSTNLQAWDFRPGANFILEMQRAAAEADRTIAVLSPDYLTAHYTQPEWAAAFARDSLLPVRVRECKLEGLLPQIIYIDLFGLTEIAAKETLLAGVKRGRAKPANAPAYPGARRSKTTAPRFPGALPEIWNIPHPRNPNFTGREGLLRDLRATLTSGRAAAIAPISGLGGAGKTQLALEYAYRHAADYDLVWWMRAEEPTTLAADFAALAVPLGVPQSSPPDQQANIAAVRAWLGHHPKWLLVFDNLPHPAASHDYLPGGVGHVLITSRDPNFRAIAQPLHLPVLPRPEAIEFLYKRTGLDEPAAADNLCGLLGDLPLAIEHAGAYIETAAITIADYLDRYRKHPAAVHDPVARTWEISIERLRHESPSALDLLHLIAFLAPEDIDLELVAKAFPGDTELDQARSALRQYSLIDARPGPLAIHRLVQAITRERLAREGQEAKWAETAVKTISAAFPFDSDEFQTWDSCARLLPHALAAAEHSERLSVALESTSRLLNQVGLYLKNSTVQLGEAERAMKRSLAIAEKVYGPDHAVVAIGAINIGTILRAQGNLPGALRYAQRALTIDEKVYGPDHPEVSTDANNIGTILKDQGDLPGALRYAQRALAIDEKVYGPDHPTVARDANNIGQILQDQGDLAGALRYTQRALAIDEKVYEPDHPNVASDANNIGTILKAQGDLAGALSYTQRALAIDEKVYGPDHPEVATDASNIGQILKAQGDLPGALLYAERALRIRQATFGPDNPATKRAAANLASIKRALAT